MSINLIRKLFRASRLTGVSVRYRHISASKLTIHEFGDPTKVVKKEDFTLDVTHLKSHQVLIEMVQAPINPADINTIQGTYGVKPPLPFTLGNEGFGRVEQVGNAVAHLKAGDWVIPMNNAWGTWRTHAVEEEKHLMKIRNDINPTMAATLAVNPATAYRMLKDFEKLENGDVVLQNGANSAVGQCVIQLAKHFGYRTVNIVRNRENIYQLKQELSAMGADHVLTEEEMRSCKLFKNGELAAPKLVLNCVSGKAVIELVKAMADSGTLVTYGGMSRQPLIVPTSAFIFKNIRLVGYWMTRWNWHHKHSTKREEMFHELSSMAHEGILKPPKHELISIDEFQEAISKASDTSRLYEGKLIFKFCDINN